MIVPQLRTSDGLNSFIFIMCADAALQIDRIYTKETAYRSGNFAAIAAQPDRRKRFD